MLEKPWIGIVVVSFRWIRVLEMGEKAVRGQGAGGRLMLWAGADAGLSLVCNGQELAMLDREQETAARQSFQNSSSTRTRSQFRKFVIGLKNVTVQVVMARNRLKANGGKDFFSCGGSTVRTPTCPLGTRDVSRRGL